MLSSRRCGRSWRCHPWVHPSCCKVTSYTKSCFYSNCHYYCGNCDFRWNCLFLYLNWVLRQARRYWIPSQCILLHTTTARASGILAFRGYLSSWCQAYKTYSRKRHRAATISIQGQYCSHSKGCAAKYQTAQQGDEEFPLQSHSLGATNESSPARTRVQRRPVEKS